MVTKTNKKLTAALLGISFLQMVLPLLFAVVLFSVKCAQQSIINDGDGNTSLVRLHVSGLNISPDRELTVNGELYDVERIVKQGDGYLVEALPDRTENSVNRLNALSVETGGPAKSNASKTFLFSFLFYEKPFSWQLVRRSFQPVLHFTPASAALIGYPAGILYPPRWV